MNEPLPRPKVWRHPRLISEHAFDELRLLDCTFAEFDVAGKRPRARGKGAVVLGVPMDECPACGDRWLAWDVAQRLDELLTTMLAGDLEVVTQHFDARKAA